MNRFVRALRGFCSRHEHTRVRDGLSTARVFMPERESFESWATIQGLSTERLPTGRYAEEETYWAYEGWYGRRVYPRMNLSPKLDDSSVRDEVGDGERPVESAGLRAAS
jgi:hypothetical protein